MVQPFVLSLTAQQREELAQARDHHPKPYLRVRAAAILKVASGQSLRHVAWHGLLKSVDEETVSRWVKTYQLHGMTGLHVQSGRGRKPAFFPSRSKQ